MPKLGEFSIRKTEKDHEALIGHLLKKEPMRFSWVRKLKATDK